MTFDTLYCLDNNGVDQFMKHHRFGKVIKLQSFDYKKALEDIVLVSQFTGLFKQFYDSLPLKESWNNRVGVFCYFVKVGDDGKKTIVLFLHDSHEPGVIHFALCKNWQDPDVFIPIKKFIVSFQYGNTCRIAWNSMGNVAPVVPMKKLIMAPPPPPKTTSFFANVWQSNHKSSSQPRAWADVESDEEIPVPSWSDSD